MHRYEELERIYYKKKFKKYFLYFLIVLFISGIAVLLLNQKNIKHSKLVKEKKEIKIVKEIKKPKPLKKPKQEINITKKIKEEVNISKKIKKEVNISKKHIIPPVKKLVLYPIYPDITINKPKKETKIVKKAIKKEVKKVKPKQEITPKIIIKTKKETIDELIKAYKNAPGYTKAIKLANLYFLENNYKESIKWAKKANKLNPEDYESWYLFAKSLIKLGKITKAKKILKAYTEAYGVNQNIEKLMRSIK